MAWLPEGEKSVKICLFVLTEFTNVSDRHADERTDRPHDDIDRACIVSCGKNGKLYIVKTDRSGYPRNSC